MQYSPYSDCSKVIGTVHSSQQMEFFYSQYSAEPLGLSYWFPTTVIAEREIRWPAINLRGSSEAVQKKIHGCHKYRLERLHKGNVEENSNPTVSAVKKDRSSMVFHLKSGTATVGESDDLTALTGVLSSYTHGNKASGHVNGNLTRS